MFPDSILLSYNHTENNYHNAMARPTYSIHKLEKLQICHAEIASYYYMFNSPVLFWFLNVNLTSLEGFLEKMIHESLQIDIADAPVVAEDTQHSTKQRHELNIYL